jgi:hypothetical protein
VTINVKAIAAKVAAYAAATVAALNAVASIASSVKLPAQDQAIITALISLGVAIESVATQTAAAKAKAAGK